MSDLPEVDGETIVQCFNFLYDPNSSPATRKQADQHLLLLEGNPVALLTQLLTIFEQNGNPKLCFQALVYCCNVLKRNWSMRRYNKAHAEFENVKKAIRGKLLDYILAMDKRYTVSLFDMLGFVVKLDFPHAYPAFSAFVLSLARNLQMDELHVLIFKQLKEIFQQLAERKGAISKKNFEDCLRELLLVIGKLSVDFKTLVEQAVESGAITSVMVKLSKYCDQILLQILRLAPVDFMDEEMAPQIAAFVLAKLQSLLVLHNGTGNRSVRAMLQKNIKSLIYDLGLLELSKPLMLSWIIKEVYDIELYVLKNNHLFVKNTTLRYALIGIKRIIKEFAYYAEDSVFNSSIRSKTTSTNCLTLRKLCTSFYTANITQSVVEQLLKFLIFNSLSKSVRNEHSLFDLDEGLCLDKGHEKELSLEGCVILLIEGLLERFTTITHRLVTQLIMEAIKYSWTNIDTFSLNNLFGVLALLPATCKKNDVAHLQEIPVLDILQFIYTSQSFKLKFASIVSGWMEAFTNDQLGELTGVLLNFIESESSGEEEVEVLMGCCQCLNKIILQRSAAIDMQNAIQRVVPVSLVVFQKIDNPEVLWPMVTLISNIITKVEFNTQLIVAAVDSYKLSLLIANQSHTLIEALCDMFKGFLCVIPRNMPAKSVYELVCRFLNNHLSSFSNVNHEKIFHLWYIAIREYSPIQGCDQLYVELFFNHFRKNLYRKTSTLIYILEEYMLSGLIASELDQLVNIIIDCYVQAEEMDKEEKEKLKIAALSFQITLITKFDLEQVNSDRMLHLILRDFFNFDLTAVTPTIHNSLLSIVNRYIIIHLHPFLNYLSVLNIPLHTFLPAYFQNMEYLTSHSAFKINAIALLSLLNHLDRGTALEKFTFIMEMVLPEIQKFKGTLQNGPMTTFIGRVDNSPSLRFASNTLSSRKEDIRRKDCFDSIALDQLFREQILKFTQREGISLLSIAQNLTEKQANLFLSLF